MMTTELQMVKDHWTEEIYQDKLKNMAKVMAEIGAEVSGNTPQL